MLLKKCLPKGSMALEKKKWVKSMLFGKNGHTVYVYMRKGGWEERLYSAIYDRNGDCLSTGYKVGGRPFDPSYWLVNGHPEADEKRYRPPTLEELVKYRLTADIDFR